MRKRDILYNNFDYKDIIKKLIQLTEGMNNKELANRIPIQPTYLSKLFNDDGTHLKDETLYRIGKILELNEEEIDYLILIKTHQCSESPERKEHLYRKIQDLNNLYLDGVSKSATSQLELESKYLLNPKCALIQLALHIDTYEQNPRLLCQELNISHSQLVDILDILEQNKFIIRGDNPLAIKKVNRAALHIESGQLMRVHQYLFKTLVATRVQETHENHKKSFNAVFNMDESSFKEAIDLCNKFVNDMQMITEKSRAEGLYQLSFDLFKWL